MLPVWESSGGAKFGNRCRSVATGASFGVVTIEIVPIGRRFCASDQTVKNKRLLLHKWKL